MNYEHTCENSEQNYDFELVLFRFGRRPVLLVSYLSSLTFAVLSAFSTSYVMFIIMRLFTGMGLAGISIISIALSKETNVNLFTTFFVFLLHKRVMCFTLTLHADVEWCSIERRTFSGVIISLDWTLGNWMLAGIAYCVNEWRMLILAVTSPLILAIIAWRY